MRALYLANHIPWFGAHTGYPTLTRYIEEAGVPTRVYHSRSSFTARALGKAVSLLRRHGRISQADAAARMRLELGLRLHGDGVGHLLFGEDHLPFWQDAPDALRQRSVLTLHQPSAFWTDPQKIAALPACPHIIVLWQREMDWFRSRLKGGKVHFVRHGVDLEFFTSPPEAVRSSEPRRLLYAGVHLRNTAMLARVIAKLDQHHDDLHFDLLVPTQRRAEPALKELLNHPRVTWHAGVSDEQLRDLYHRAYLLLLPMNDSGMNTAIVEALACGLPPVTTDVGGVRDYGGGTTFPVVENNDDEGMVRLIEQYLADPGFRDATGRGCRAFAETELAWPALAQRHIEIYREVLG